MVSGCRLPTAGVGSAPAVAVGCGHPPCPTAAAMATTAAGRIPVAARGPRNDKPASPALSDRPVTPRPSQSPTGPRHMTAPVPAPPGTSLNLPYEVQGQTIRPLESESANDKPPQPDRGLRSCEGCGFGVSPEPDEREAARCPACGWAHDPARMTALNEPPSQSWGHGSIQPPSNVRISRPPGRVEYWNRTLG